MKTFLDTHAAVMLWNGDDLSPKAQDLLERSALFVSPAAGTGWAATGREMLSARCDGPAATTVSVCATAPGCG